MWTDNDDKTDSFIGYKEEAKTSPFEPEFESRQ